MEVLSVVAVQVKSIQDAIKMKKTTFMFDDVEIKITPTVGLFITMNPGYAGRTELPENLKALFRCVCPHVHLYIVYKFVCVCLCVYVLDIHVMHLEILYQYIVIHLHVCTYFSIYLLFYLLYLHVHVHVCTVI